MREREHLVGGHIYKTRNRLHMFNLSHVLLLAEINLIVDKYSYKKNLLRTYRTGGVKIITALLIEIIALYI